MKKITLLVLAFSFGVTFQGQSQTTMTQNTDQILVPGGVSCPGGDNEWYRQYDFVVTPTPYTGNVLLLGAEFAIEAIDGDEDITVNVYDWTGQVFPIGFDSLNPPPVLATATFTVGLGDVGTIVPVTFDVPATVSDDANIILQFVQPTVSGNGLFLGVTVEETDFSYISSVQCAITGEPVTFDSIDFPDAHTLLNLVVDQGLAAGDNIADLISVYPNPAQDVLNVNIPASIEVSSSALYEERTLVYN